MTEAATKAEVTLDGVALAANAGIQWKLTTGTIPYSTVLTVHTNVWEGKLKQKMGKPVELKIKDARGVEIVVKDVYILHEVPSDGPRRTSFVVADKRWKWAYRLIARDYNVTKKTGTRFVPGEQGGLPVEVQVTVDEYQYRGYSMDGLKRWTAKRAVEDCLKALTIEDPDASGGNGAGTETFKIDSFPIEQDDEAGSFTLQNVSLRDQGDIALSRLLSYIPGAEVTVALDGTIVVFDAADLRAAEEAFKDLPPATWDGDKAVMIKRKAIRPREVFVYYQREVELLLEYSDDYGGTAAQPGRNYPFVENVLPTVDPETTLLDGYDPETNQSRTTKVRQGTWVPVQQWLEAMDIQRPDASAPWTFETLRCHWHIGSLDGALGGNGRFDIDADGNVQMRIQAIKQHFRQTFRISRRYMERIRDLRAIRVGVLDPVTGARAPAAVWGQACLIKSTKGNRVLDPELAAMNTNVDYRPQPGNSVKDTPPGPADVNILDEELGIFRLEWLSSPYGTVSEYVMCHLVNEGDQPTVVSRNLDEQETRSMGHGMKIENGQNGLTLRKTLDYQIMVTMVPSAPNTNLQFHRVKVRSEDIADIYRNEYGIQGGDGPPLHIFVSPGEATARFKLDDEQVQQATLEKLLGLDDGPGLPHDEPMNGYVLINEDVELKAHAKAVAAEFIIGFADNMQGRVTSRVPDAGLKLEGNMASASIAVAAAPSAKVIAIHEFPGQQKPISRMALLSDAARQIILGTLPFKG